MKLRDIHGQEFELKIQEYQYPDIIDDDWDSNWLNIRIAVNSKKGIWSNTSPSLLTFEVERLLEWLVAVAEGNNQSEISFTEPDFKFKSQSKNDTIIVKVYFELDARPQHKASSLVGDDEFFVDLQLEKEELLRAVQSLKKDLKRFPSRAQEPEGSNAFI